MRLGDGEGQASVVFGPAADEMGSAETLAEHGDIVLSPEAWRLCDRQNFVVEDTGDDGTMKVGLEPVFAKLVCATEHLVLMV